MNHRLAAAHNAIDVVAECNTDEQRLIAAKCRALLTGYDARWRDAPYVPLGVEKVLTADMVNPDTGRASRSLQVAGKLDVVVSYNGKTVIFDHKTTSQDITDPNGPYWRQLIVEGQVNHYLLLEWMHGNDIEMAVWDVVRKPSIRPKELTKATRASIVADGMYCGSRVVDSVRHAIANGEERETPELFELRLAQDCTTERPDWYFQRRAVPRTNEEMMEYARELWQHGQDLLHARKQANAVRNSGACMLYGSPCKFLGLCSGHDTVDSGNWNRRRNVHPELPTDGDGRNVLTNSRIRCFQTCRRKHYYQYELGIERYDEEEREALVFGTVYHAGLNAWWQSAMEVPNGDDHHPATEVGRSTVGTQLAV